MNTIIRATSKLGLRPIVDRVVTGTNGVRNGHLTIPRRHVHNTPLTYDFARERIMLVLRLYDKIDGEKITLDSNFTTDLGLDSLDHVDIIMQLEDEFKFEIPDKDMERLLTPRDILKYITDKEEAYKELQDMHAHHHNHHDDHHADHGKMLSGHGHGQAASGHESLGNQKRGFCSMAYTSRRFMSGKDEKMVFQTSFGAKPAEDPKIEDIQQRVLRVCAKYDKIDSSKLDLTSHFVDDLGLDSLDHVEIMMELEDEFGLEIPDQDAEKLQRPAQIAGYIFHKMAPNVKVQDRPY